MPVSQYTGYGSTLSCCGAATHRFACRHTTHYQLLGSAKPNRIPCPPFSAGGCLRQHLTQTLTIITLPVPASYWSTYHFDYRL